MAQEADSSSALSPQVVGNAFVEQYYCILHQNPDVVHRFYQESSMVSRPDQSGSMTSVTTIKHAVLTFSLEYFNKIFCPELDFFFLDQEINDMIVSLDYQNYNVQIFSADAQASYDNAPQDKGYFVLNDILRYVDEIDEKDGSAGLTINDVDENAPAAPLTPDPEPTQVPNNTVLNHVNPVNEDAKSSNEASHPLDNGQVLVAEKAVAADPPVVASQNDARPAKEPVASKNEEEAPKKSFASVVHDLNKSKAPFNVIMRAPSVKTVESSRATAAPKVAAPPSSNSSLERNNDHAAKGHSIFVGNLPDSATVDQLKLIFEQFGPVKPDGNSNGGRFPLNQGGYRDNNFRGRGNYNEGRNYRRNDYEKPGDFSGRGRVNNGRNGEVNHKGPEGGIKVACQGPSQGGMMK
ncbi:hypothetical protein CUMW_080490, partial [Citrus unshiu]